MLGRSQGAGGLPKLSVALGPTQPEPRLPSDEDMAPKPAPAPPPTPRIEKKDPPPPPVRPQAKAAPKEDDLRKKAMEAGGGGVDRRRQPDRRHPRAQHRRFARHGGKDLFDRTPVITLDAGEPVLLLSRDGLKADDFRGDR